MAARLKILLAADGSEYTRHAARALASHARRLDRKPRVHVLHVCPPIPYPGAAAVAGTKAVAKYQRESSLAALAPAAKVLERAGIGFDASWIVGDVAERIAAHVEKNGIDLVIIGSHGHGALANLAMGSVATKCIAALRVPVMVVPAPRGRRGR